MIIKIEETKYYIDDDIIINSMREKANNAIGTKIKLPKGPTIDLTSKSLLSTAIRQLIAMVIFPIIDWMSETLKVPLPKREKHADSIKYAIDSYLTLLKYAASNSEIVIEPETYVDDMLKIKSIEIIKENNNLPVLLQFLNNKGVN